MIGSHRLHWSVVAVFATLACDRRVAEGNHGRATAEVALASSISKRPTAVRIAPSTAATSLRAILQNDVPAKPIRVESPLPAIDQFGWTKLLLADQASHLSRGRPPISENDAVSGAADAPVTAVLFGDLECPYTAKAVAAMRGLQNTYGSATLRLVWKNRPLEFHRQALPAARAAEAVHVIAGGEALWRFVDSTTQGLATLDDPELTDRVGALGVSQATYAWLTGEGAGELDAKIEEDIAAARAADVRGVPVVWIGAHRFDGAVAPEMYAGAIDEELGNAP